MWQFHTVFKVITQIYADRLYFLNSLFSILLQLKFCEDHDICENFCKYFVALFVKIGFSTKRNFSIFLAIFAKIRKSIFRGNRRKTIFVPTYVENPDPTVSESHTSIY